MKRMEAVTRVNYRLVQRTATQPHADAALRISHILVFNPLPHLLARHRTVPAGAKDAIVGAGYAESQSPLCALQFPLARLILIGRLYTVRLEKKASIWRRRSSLISVCAVAHDSSIGPALLSSSGRIVCHCVFRCRAESCTRTAR